MGTSNEEYSILFPYRLPIWNAASDYKFMQSCILENQLGHGQDPDRLTSDKDAIRHIQGPIVN